MSNELETMASSEKDSAKNEPSPEGNDDTLDKDGDLSDNEGLSSEQEDALNKIMAEIEGQDDAASDKEAETESESENEGLDPEQEDALNKIMAEIEGQDDATSEKDAETESESDSEGLDPEQEDALNKIMAEIEGQDDATSEKDAETESDSDSEGLDPDQEDALNKIMAEIEDQDDTASEKDADTGSESESENEGLDPEQEDALNKIMAEIEAKDEAPAEPGADGLSKEQEAALENIMAEIEGGDEGDSESAAPSGGEDQASAPPVDPDEPAAEAQVHHQEEEDPPIDESPAMAEDTTDSEPEVLPEAGTVEKLPATDDLMSQIQAAAQGPEDELNVSAPSPENVKAPASPAPVSDMDTESDQPTAPLAEISDEPPPEKVSPGKRSGKKQVKKSTSRKIVKVLTWTGGAVAAVLLAAVGTYYWLSNGYFPKMAATPPSPVTAPLEISSDPGASDLSLEDELLADTPEDQVPAKVDLEISPESQRLAELSSRIQTRRDDMLAKAREVDELSAYYQEGIEKIIGELVDHIKTKQIASLDAGRKDTAILMGLETIQRRAGYIAKLSLPRQQLQAASEELLYLARKASILSMIAAKSSGSNLDPFAKQVDEAIERLTRQEAGLSLETAAASEPSMGAVWKRVWAAHMNAPKKERPAAVASRRNTQIGGEVCGGEFSRVGELTVLTSDTAACLAAWEGKDLFLNNLERLSPEAAHSLSRWEGEWLVLNGLKALSPEAAKQLAAWKGRRLSLNGLKELPSDATKALAKWQGHQLELIGLHRLTAWDNPAVTLYVSSEVRDKLAR